MSDRQDNRNPAGNKTRDRGYTEGRQGRSNRKPRPGRVSGGARPPQGSAVQETRALQAEPAASHDGARAQAGQRQPRSRNRKQFVSEDKGKQPSTAPRVQNPNTPPRDPRPAPRAEHRESGENRGRGNLNRAYQKEAQAVETMEDIRRDNDRIEKEIWLEIADIHTIKLDF